MTPEIELKDLVADCDKCQGAGMVSSSPTPPAGVSMMLATSNVRCPACNGDKLIFTPAGRTLFDFMKRLQIAGMLPSR